MPQQIRIPTLVVAALLIVSGLFACQVNQPKDRIFRVGLRGLPDRLDPLHNEINIYHYIYQHLYSPLFDFKRDGSVSSLFLDLTTTKARNQKFNDFSLCLKKDVRFNNGSFISGADLLNGMVMIHDKNPSLPEVAEITIDGHNCVRVALKVGDLEYFEKLVSSRNTILKTGTETSRQPVGIGPYSLVEMTPSLLVLKGVHGRFKYFDTMKFIKVETPEQGLRAGLMEWNHLWQHLGALAPIPEKIKASFQTFVNHSIGCCWLSLTIRTSG